MPNARVAFERTHSHLRLLPACRKRIAQLKSKLERLDSFHLFYSEHGSNLSTDLGPVYMEVGDPR